MTRAWRSDNLTVVPASQLPFKQKWQTIANRLPQGTVLFVVPSQELPVKTSMRRVALTLRARGRLIGAVTSGRVG